MKRAASLVVLCVAANAWGDPPPQVLHACVSMQDPAERLACFDRAMSESATPAKASFGEDALPPSSRPPKAQDEMTLLATIKEMHEVRPQIYAISLSNGQVWRQEEGSHLALFFHVGDGVRIEKGALGSYHMSTAATGAKNWVRVSRIQ
jgi:hypothetical protein